MKNIVEISSPRMPTCAAIFLVKSLRVTFSDQVKKLCPEKYQRSEISFFKMCDSFAGQQT